MPNKKLIQNCICINKTDSSISTKDVTIKSQGNKFNTTALINVEKAIANDVKVDFRGEDKNFNPTQNQILTINVAQYVNQKYVNQNVSVLWDLNKTEFVSIFIDSSNIIAETDEKNNFVKKSTRPPIKAYVEISTDYALDSVITNYLSQYVDIVSQGSQDVNIYVGRKNGNIPKESEETVKNQKWKVSKNIISFNSKSEGLPYNGLVVKKGNNIYVLGNEIDGDIVALRKLVNNRLFYFSKIGANRVDYIGEEDLDGIFVFDYLHTDENQVKYRQNDANFRKVVENVLNGDVSTLAIKRVLTTNDNTSLRIKHINAELSPKFREFANPQPVVLSRGLWSNLFTWENFGFELARGEIIGARSNKPRDVWLIEITGGPNTECANCPNYNYNDLRDYYWPALISGVQAYSSQSKVDYVGYSTGGGIGIKSYEKYYQGTSNTMGYYLNDQGVWTSFTLPANFVDNMALIAPIGAFDGETKFTDLTDEHGTELLSRLSNKNHYTRGDIVREANKICTWVSDIDCKIISSALTEAENVSHNYFSDIVIDVQNKTNLNPKLSSINRLLIIYGSVSFIRGDGLVPDEDISYMYSNSIANKKYKASIFSIHAFMDSRDHTYDPLLSKFLNNLTYTDDEIKDRSIEED